MSKRSLNKTLLIGWLGADPELRYTPNGGTAVATLRVAANESWKERASGERKQPTEWHRAVCFGRLAEGTRNRGHWRGSSVKRLLDREGARR